MKRLHVWALLATIILSAGSMWVVVAHAEEEINDLCDDLAEETCDPGPDLPPIPMPPGGGGGGGGGGESDPIGRATPERAKELCDQASWPAGVQRGRHVATSPPEPGRRYPGWSYVVRYEVGECHVIIDPDTGRPTHPGTIAPAEAPSESAARGPNPDSTDIVFECDC